MSRAQLRRQVMRRYWQENPNLRRKMKEFSDKWASESGSINVYQQPCARACYTKKKPVLFRVKKNFLRTTKYLDFY